MSAVTSGQRRTMRDRIVRVMLLVAALGCASCNRGTVRDDYQPAADEKPTGKCKLDLAVEGETLKISLKSDEDEDVHGVIVLTYAKQSPLMAASMFTIGPNSSMVKALPLNWEGNKCVFYRLEMYEESENGVMLPTYCVMLSPWETEDSAEP